MAYRWKNPTAIRLTNQETEHVEGLLTEALADFDLENSTGRSMFLALLERSLTTRRRNDEARPQDADQIEQLNNQIGRLKIDVDLREQKILKLEENNRDLCLICDEKNEDIRHLKNNPDLKENHYLIEIPPLAVKVLEIEAEAAQKKTGKRFSIGEILTNSFWESVTVGRVYPWRQWSAAEISNIAKAIKYAE